MSRVATKTIADCLYTSKFTIVLHSSLAKAMHPSIFMCDRSRCRVGIGVFIIARSACHSEHAQMVPKWLPTMNLATECTEKVYSDNLKLR